MNERHILLDSGAYTIHTKKIAIDIDDYAKFIKKNGKMFCAYFNMDVIGDGGGSFDNWQYLKKQGIDTIPVYHVGTSKRFLRKYLRETEHVAIGAIANLSSAKRLSGLTEIWNEYLRDDKGVAKYKVHGLGLTALPIVEEYPWFSVDSFTPIVSAAWGSIFLPMIRKNTVDFSSTFICKVSDQAHHKANTMTSWLSLPTRSRQIYMELFKEQGLELGQVSYQEKKARRGKEKIVPATPQFFNMTEAAKNEDTITGNWELRAQWNLYVWGNIASHFPMNTYCVSGETFKQRTNIYMGVSNNTVLNIIEGHSEFDMLVSFAYYNEDKSTFKYLKSRRNGNAV